jgi:hypothetical protein
MNMFPEETHVKIVKRIDEMEAEAYGLYRRLERLRLDLQAQWKVLPSGERWSQYTHDESVHSSK